MPKKTWFNKKKIERARRSIIKDKLRAFDSRTTTQYPGMIQDTLQKANARLIDKLQNTNLERETARNARIISHETALRHFTQSHSHRHQERAKARVNADLLQYGRYRYDVAPGEKRKERHRVEDALRKFERAKEQEMKKAKKARNN